ncbi:hypothetical protein [Streptomyces sp. RG80]|uniref:hypothetical protein n=1 Tax=Streptomyces sp. RG80 TaxID=3157340 RepID=UPI00338FCC08
MVEVPVSRRPLDGDQIDRRPARIRDLLARWDALRPGDGEAWRGAFVPFAEAEAAGFEARNGLRLPQNYRRYPLELGDPGDGLMRYAAPPVLGVCRELVISATGYGGGVTHLVGEDGRCYSVADVKPGGPARARAAATLGSSGRR